MLPINLDMDKKDIKVDFSELRDILNKLVDDAEKKQKEQKPKSELDILRERIDLLESRVYMLEWSRYYVPCHQPGDIVKLPYITYKPNTGTGDWFTIPSSSITFGSSNQKADPNIGCGWCLSGSTEAFISGSASHGKI